MYKQEKTNHRETTLQGVTVAGMGTIAIFRIGDWGVKKERERRGLCRKKGGGRRGSEMTRTQRGKLKSDCQCPLWRNPVH